MKQTTEAHMIYGLRAIIEHIVAGKEIERILLQQGLKGGLALQLEELARHRQVPVSKVPLPRLNRTTRKNHQGAIAYVSPVRYQPIDEVVARVYESGEQPLVVVLDGITDVRNFGSICRTAECMGVHAVVIPIKGAAQVSADAIKTSAGALNHLPINRAENLAETVSRLKESGLKVVACTEKSDQTIYQADFNQPIVLMMGAEDAGISAPLLALADEKLSIPILGQIASLNVGSACSIILGEVVRQTRSG